MEQSSIQLVDPEKPQTFLPKEVLNNLESYGDFLSYYVQLEEATTTVSWLKADLLAEFSNRQGETSLGKLALDINEPFPTVTNYIRTSRAFPPDTRIPNVPFSSHMIASFSDSYNDKEKRFETDNRFGWVEKAADEKLTTRKLDQLIKKEKETKKGTILLLCEYCKKADGDVATYSVYREGKRGFVRLKLHDSCWITITASILDHYDA